MGRKKEAPPEPQPAQTVELLAYQSMEDGSVVFDMLAFDDPDFASAVAVALSQAASLAAGVRAGVLAAEGQ